MKTKLLNFWNRYWKVVLASAAAIIMIVVLIICIVRFNPLSNLFATKKVMPGTPGIVTIDGQEVNIQDTQDLAEAYPVTAEAGVLELKLSDSRNVDVSTTIGGFPAGILTNTDKSTYSMDLSGIGDGSNVLLTISIGGDGSWVSKRLSDEVDTYYLAVRVSNPEATAEATAETLGIPNGQIFFGEDSYHTYGSEEEAQQAISGQKNSFTIPKAMVENGIPLRADHNNKTARIWVMPCMVDDEGIDRYGVRLNADSEWAGNLDVSEFAGHQLTLMIKAEDSMALTNGYSYVSFWVPKID